MGRVWSRQIVSMRCDVRTCPVNFSLTPAMPHDSTWHDHLSQLSTLVDRGWSVVLTEKLRTYCPDHEARARMCTCRTNPSFRHFCVVHGEGISELLWDATQIPLQVSQFLKATA